MGIAEARTGDMRVLFEGSGEDIARANMGLRTADRVLLVLGEFPAPDFDALYEGVRAVPWRDLLSAGAAVTVHARSVKSRITATPSIQSVAKKAIIDALSGAQRGKARPGARAGARLPETGLPFDVEVTLRADQASVCLDTTGSGLHKRGYRTEAGEAPLRENLAAALVLLSRWDPSRPFADPLCGSGTIAIEAALYGAGIAPGLGRTFASEAWPLFPSRVWEAARERARAEKREGLEFRIHASDQDGQLVEAAKRNARRAKVSGIVRFQAAQLSAFRPQGDYGCLVCNPPYGERIGEAQEVEALYRAMGELFRGMPTWSLFALSANPDFQRFFGARATRNRKLYNGNIRCWCYQYFGPLRRDVIPDHPGP
jgi:putative N6-adenine-specific DNA methylase